MQRDEIKHELYGLSDAVRADAELSGQRNARGAFNCIASHGYATSDRAFREIGYIMLADRSQSWGMPTAVSQVWLASALAQFEALADGRGHGAGEQ